MITTLLLIFIMVFMSLVPKKKFYGCAIICFIVISTMVALWQPNEEADLYKHYEFLHDLSYMSFMDAISMNINNVSRVTSIYTLKFVAGYPLFCGYCWVIQKFLFKEFLPFSIIMFVMLIKLYILRDCDKKYHLPKKMLVLCFVCFICLTNFLALTGLRNPAAYTLYALAIYWDLFKHKHLKWCLLIYIGACAIHSACLMLLACRILYLFFSKLNYKLYYILIPVIFAIIPYILVNLNGNSSFMLLQVVSNYSDYFLKGSQLSSTIETVFTTIIYACITYYLILDRKKNSETKDLCNFLLFIMVFNILNIFNYDIYVRFTIFYLPLFTLIFVDLSRTTANFSKINSFFIKFACLIIFIYYCSTSIPLLP